MYSSSFHMHIYIYILYKYIYMRTNTYWGIHGENSALDRTLSRSMIVH